MRCWRWEDKHVQPTVHTCPGAAGRCPNWRRAARDPGEWVRSRRAGPWTASDPRLHQRQPRRTRPAQPRALKSCAHWSKTLPGARCDTDTSYKGAAWRLCRHSSPALPRASKLRPRNGKLGLLCTHPTFRASRHRAPLFFAFQFSIISFRVNY